MSLQSYDITLEMGMFLNISNFLGMFWCYRYIFKQFLKNFFLKNQIRIHLITEVSISVDWVIKKEYRVKNYWGKEYRVKEYQVKEYQVKGYRVKGYRS